MHDPMECLNDLLAKVASGDLVDYIRNNKACALKKGFCLGYHGADYFCDEPENGPVIGSDGDKQELIAAVVELDGKLNGPQPAEGPLTSMLIMAAIKRIVEYIMERAAE